MDVSTACAALVAPCDAARPWVSGRRRSRSGIKAPSVWLLCAGAVAVLPDLFVSGVVWLVALAVLPGTIAVVGATLLILVLLVVSVRRPTRWVRVLLGARAATPAERAVLQPALARLAAAGVAEAQEAEVLLRRRRTTHARLALALRSGGSSSAWVLLISDDLTHAAAQVPSTIEVTTLLAHAIGRHRAAGKLAGRCALMRATWCVPGRIVADVVHRMPVNRASAPSHLLSAVRLLGLLVLARGIAEGEPWTWSILLSILAASCLKPRLDRRWHAHLDAGGKQAVQALQRQAMRDPQALTRQSTTCETRTAHLQLLPQPPPD